MRVLLLLAANFFLFAPPAVAQTRDVLVIFSNNRLLPANFELDRGIREAIASSAERDVELFAEFLDLPSFSGQAYEHTVSTYLREKYAPRPPETIVAVGGEALEFLLHHRAGLFPHVPVVHVGADTSFVESIKPLPADVIGVPIEFDYAGTVDLALHLHPDTRRLVVVTGASDWDREWESDLRVGFAHLEGHLTVEFLAGLPTDSVVNRLAELGSNDVVFTPGYFTDAAGREFQPRDSVEVMTAASGASVYGPYSTFIGTGIVGGRMPSYVEMGRQAGEIVAALLDGAAPATLMLPESVPARVQIDWRQARRWNVRAEDIPRDAIVHFREPTFWEAYRGRAMLAIGVFLLQAALIAALLAQRRMRRQTALALEESETRMRLVARAVNLSMWVWDVARDKVWTSAGRRGGSGPSNVASLRFEEVLETVHPADRERFGHAVRQAVANNEELDVEYRSQQPGADERWISVRGRVESGGSGRLVGIGLDVTPRKIAEQQAARDRAALTHMTRVSMLGQLSASIAHQLNQPLAAILGNAEAARKMLQRERLDVSELKAICDDIVSEDIRAAEVIRRLGALYKRGEMKFVQLDLNELVMETLGLVHTELMSRQVIPVTELAPSLPAIEGDRVQLQQVLLNLILNAADAMSEVDPTGRRLLVRTGPDGTDARLCVVDQGTGIAPENIKNVFDPFWSTKTGGTGIGLAICQSIVAAHRGSLTVANNRDRGATFCATLPVRQVT
jgi:C4-dicarboxylate-specific signal transduction histidine kinase